MAELPVFKIVGYAGCWLVARCQMIFPVFCYLENVSSSGECGKPATPRQILAAPPNPSVSLSFSRFFHWSHGDVGFSRSEHEFAFWRMAELGLPVRGIWNRPSAPRACILRNLRNGSRCKSTRTADNGVFWLRIVDNISQRRRQYSSSVRALQVSQECRCRLPVDLYGFRDLGHK